MIRLPFFVTPRNRYIALIVSAFISIACYTSTNHMQIYKPTLLPLSWVDTHVPFLPNTFWVYVSLYAYLISVMLVCPDCREVNRYFYSFTLQQVFACGIFLVWPTIYPRNMFPIPTDVNHFTAKMFASLRESDSPANCCPSLHVASVVLGALVLSKDPKKQPFFATWATAICLSTLTTKQHYLIDVVLGSMMGAAFYFFFHRKIAFEVDEEEVAEKLARIVKRALEKSGSLKLTDAELRQQLREQLSPAGIAGDPSTPGADSSTAMAKGDAAAPGADECSDPDQQLDNLVGKLPLDPITSATLPLTAFLASPKSARTTRAGTTPSSHSAHSPTSPLRMNEGGEFEITIKVKV